MTTASPPSESTAADKRQRRLIAVMSCASLLLIFAVISYSAALTKNPTYDEPLHTLSGILHRVAGEFRLDAEDPPFFSFWASLPHGKNALKLELDSPTWQRYVNGEQDHQWSFTIRTFFETDENDGDKLVQRSRLMFIIVGVALGAMIAWWSWRLAGAWAGIIATLFFSLDPNFLAHSALVKNDVMLSLLFAAVTIAVWRFGQRGTWLSLAGITVATALAVNVKFSAMMIGPIVFLLLGIRALLPQAWNVVGISLTTRWKRLLVVPAVCAIVGVASYFAIWACYGFRFAPAGDHHTLMNHDTVIDMVRKARVRQRFGPGLTFTAADIAQEELGGFVNFLLFCEDKRLLPQAWIYGMTYTYSTTISRTSFLMGKESNSGFILYFPLAMLFKTPTATLLAIPIALGAVVWMLLLRRRSLQDDPDPSRRREWIDWWTATSFVIPPGIYFLSAMTSNMNIGLRHILPVYPFIFVTIGVGMAWIISRWKIAGYGVMLFLSLALAHETLRAYPDYIPFFNTPSGGYTNGFHLLSDSNLDWGQDLKQLGRWQQTHRDRPLYLSYFGIADPEFYHVKATYAPGGWPYGTANHFPPADEKCYLAVSATNLQGIYQMPDMKQMYKPLDMVKPSEILGGSIYIYELPVSESMLRNSPQ